MKIHVSTGNTYSLLEDGRIRIRDCLSNFCICCVGAHNAVLALRSSLRVSPEVCLKRLIPLNGCLEPTVYLANLRRIPAAARFAFRFDILDAADETAVAGHDLRAEAVDLARWHIWSCKHLSEDPLEVVELAIELIKGTVDFAAFLENRLRIRCHLIFNMLTIGQKMRKIKTYIRCYHMEP
jgi:hypothetical protein